MKMIAIITAMLLVMPLVSLAAPIPDTGQTKCYNNTQEIVCPQPGEDFYGQDAQYINNPQSYTKLDANGDDLPYEATEWVMVRDNVTGLIWEVKTFLDATPDYNNPHDADNTYTWYDSNPATNGGDAGTPGDGTDTEDFINALNIGQFGEYNDWRLPTIKELSSIVESSIPSPGPAINTDYFPNVQSYPSHYWSSTTASGGPDVAWVVYMITGEVPWRLKWDDYHIWPVRGGQ